MAGHVPSGALVEDPEVHRVLNAEQGYPKQRICMAYTSGSSARDPEGTLGTKQSPRSRAAMQILSVKSGIASYLAMTVYSLPFSVYPHNYLTQKHSMLSKPCQFQHVNNFLI